MLMYPMVYPTSCCQVVGQGYDLQHPSIYLFIHHHPHMNRSDKQLLYAPWEGIRGSMVRW